MTNAEKREKVIRGLEACLALCHEGYCSKECPYISDGRCWETIKRDALALLKKQEPRVMTLDEVYDLHRGDCVFVEIRDGIERNALMLYACENYYVDFRSTDYKTISKDTSLYQKRWRAWTSRPTEEQRKAVPWNE